MRNDETALLVQGQIIEAIIDRKWVIAEVCEVHPTWGTPVLCRRVGRTNRNTRYPSTLKRAKEVRVHPQELDPIPANIYADWLDEHGEYKAGSMLREAFPLGAI